MEKNETKNILQKLRKATEELFRQYELLKQLELIGQSASLEYKDCLLNIRRMKSLENMLYFMLGDNPQELSIILDEITFAALSWDLEIDLLHIEEGHKDDLIDRRIILRICDKINASNKPNPLAPIIIGEEILPLDFIKHQKVSIAVRQDFINTLLALLNGEIYSLKNSNIFASLVTAKYYISFIYDFVEADLLNNNFAINSELYWLGPAFADIEGIMQFFTTIYQRIYASGITRQITDLADIKDSGLNDIKQQFRTVYFQVIIRTCLLFDKKGTLNKIKKALPKSMVKDLLIANTVDEELPKTINFKL